jgi:hypothetical protein
MPRVPNLPKAAKSPLADADVTPANILMAAAEMHRQGRLTQPEETSGKRSIRANSQAKSLRQR